MKTPPRRSVRQTAGLTTTEYLLILACIAVNVITLASLFGGQIKVTFYNAIAQLGCGGRRLPPPVIIAPGAFGDLSDGDAGSGTEDSFGGETKQKTVQHPVTLYPQPTGMTCWSAATTMLFGGRFSAGPGEAALGNNHGLINTRENLEKYADSYGLTLHAPQSWTAQGVTDLLDRGPIMVAGLMPSGHVVVVGGYRSGGTAATTHLHVYDPWPPGVGSEYWINYADWVRKFPEATTYILHQ